MAADNEDRLLSKAIRDRDITPLIEAGIQEDWFYSDMNRQVYRFLIKHKEKYGEVPTAVTVKDNFPTYTLHAVEDNVEYLLDQLIEYRKRQKIIQALTYSFTNEIGSLMSQDNPNDLLMSHDGDYPLLLSKLLQDDVSIETVCIMNSIMNFVIMWDKKIADTIHYPKISKTIKKYTPFIKVEQTKYKIILKKEYNANTENIS